MEESNEYKSLKEFVLDWNIRFPIDRWWREKHSISFNSPAHRESSLLDQLIEFEEDRLFKELRDNYKEKSKDNYKYIPGTGNYMRERKISQEEHDKMFDEINLEDYDNG